MHNVFFMCLINVKPALQVNYSKTEAMWIGSSRNNAEASLGLKWVNSVKAIGIFFTYKEIQNNCKKTFMTKIFSCRRDCGVAEVSRCLVR